MTYTPMLDLARVDGFDWDAGNSRKSAEKHGVSQAEAEEVFFSEPLLVSADDRHSADEPRYHALGRTGDGRYLQVTFTMCAEGRLIRVISARDMHKRERSRYEQEA